MPPNLVCSICVFCGAGRGDKPAYKEAAADLGTQMAESGLRLVYGGGNVGIMGAVADAVLAGGGKAIGVIPKFLRERETAHKELSELHVVDSMHTRKRLMFDLADAFVILPGGLGTIEEAFEMITWRQLGQHVKPIIFINTNNYWQPFCALVQNVEHSGFAHGDITQYFKIAPDPISAIRLLTTTSG